MPDTVVKTMGTAVPAVSHDNSGTNLVCLNGGPRSVPEQSCPNFV